MNICIFGGGPTGLRLTDELSKKGFSVELHERESKLGGCWKVDWENGYYREHSPRVMSTGYKRVLKLFSHFNQNTSAIYGSKIHTFYIFLNYFYSHLTKLDILKALNGMYFVRKEDKRTLGEWMEDNNFSEKGKKALDKLALSIATNKDEILAYPFFISISEGQGAKLIQSRNNDEWIYLWEKELSQRKNVKIFKDIELTKFEITNNKLSAICGTDKRKADTYICSMPLYALKDVLSKSPKEVKNNWMDFEDFEKFTSQSSYSGIGFQLHFTEKIKTPITWCGKLTDWSIEVISISSYSEAASKNPFIKDVWSCVIVNTNAYSNYLQKKVNEIDDINKVINELIRQLSVSHGIVIRPFKVTTSKGIFYNKKNKYWDMPHSAYNPSFGGALPVKGNIDNLYSVGPHNIYEIALLEGAFKSADNFVSEYIKK